MHWDSLNSGILFMHSNSVGISVVCLGRGHKNSGKLCLWVCTGGK